MLGAMGLGDNLKTSTQNNSIVIFMPSDRTLHAVKATYDHLLTQRTQIYGNLWYDNHQTEYTLKWEEIDLLRKVRLREEERKRTRSIKISINFLVYLIYAFFVLVLTLLMQMREILFYFQ